MKTASKWKISGAAAVLAAASVAMIATSSTGGPKIENVSDIVPSFSGEQRVADQLPKSAARTFAPAGIDSETTRFVGESTVLKYYAAPLGNEEICLIAVDGQGSATQMGCTIVKGFEGLRVANGEMTEQAWLVAATGAEKTLDSVDRREWKQTAPNFLVKSASQDG